MPALKNKGHEAFAQGIAKGLTDRDAYLRAGYQVSPKSASEAAYRLRRRVDVRDRIEELTDKPNQRIAVEQIVRGIKTGRTTLYRPELADHARRLSLLGLRGTALAEALNVDDATVSQWRREHRAFDEGITRGGVLADAKVAESAYHRALGYRAPAVKIFPGAQGGAPVVVPYIEHYPPDTNAALAWLARRQPELWRERKEVDVTGTLAHRLLAQTPEQRAAEALALAARMAARLAEIEATDAEEVEDEPGGDGATQQSDEPE